jgi:hypothetical protein
MSRVKKRNGVRPHFAARGELDWTKEKGAQNHGARVAGANSIRGGTIGLLLGLNRPNRADVFRRTAPPHDRLNAHTPLRMEVLLVRLKMRATAIVWDRFVFLPGL